MAAACKAGASKAAFPPCQLDQSPGAAGGAGLKVAPPPFAHALIRKAIAPKAELMIGLVSQILELLPTHIAVQRGLAFLMTQCMGLLLAPKESALPFSLAKDAATLPDDVLAYALAGFDALRMRYSAS